eukprot:3155571-Alexandrium_andersonii.AAC.1
MSASLVGSEMCIRDRLVAFVHKSVVALGRAALPACREHWVAPLVAPGLWVAPWVAPGLGCVGSRFILAIVGAMGVGLFARAVAPTS